MRCPCSALCLWSSQYNQAWTISRRLRVVWQDGVAAFCCGRCQRGEPLVRLEIDRATRPLTLCGLWQYLRSGDDIAKIANIRKKLAAERASIEAKLKSGAKDQLDATRDGLLKLRDTRVSVTRIREEMVNVERLCEDPKTSIEGFSKISQVSEGRY